MSMAWYGLPAAVIRMKARRIEREEREREKEFHERLMAMQRRLFGPGAVGEEPKVSQPEWARWLAQEEAHGGWEEPH